MSALTPYYRLQGNVCRLYGVIRSGTANLAAFTLPAGFRPFQQMDFSELAIGSAAVAYVGITAAGAVTPTATDATGITLDGITFTVD